MKILRMLSIKQPRDPTHAKPTLVAPAYIPSPFTIGEPVMLTYSEPGACCELEFGPQQNV